MHYSFDVFDTCLTRVYANPETIFYFLALEVLRTKEHDSKELISEFTRLRIQAEDRARKFSHQEDISLNKIYEHFHELKAWDINPEKVMSAEIQIELASIRPIATIKQQILKLKQEGKRILFISDMYLPHNVIEQMLVEHGFAEKNDPIYVSGTIGLTKRSGNLFKYVLEKEGISKRNLHHTGNNARVDYLSPRRLGIKAYLFTNELPNRYEKAIINSNIKEPWICSQIAGISRATRLTSYYKQPQKDLSEVENIAANIIAPLLSSFVAWVVQNAREKGLERLYFVARDGFILLKIARAMFGETTPSFHYFYGSRQAWNAASVFKVAKKDLEFLIFNGQSSAPAHNLKRLNIAPEEISHVLIKHGFPKSSWEDQLEGSDVAKFWSVIQHPEVSKLILERAKLNRNVALDYFEQEGLLLDNKWSLVDIGWTLRTQSSLRKILSSRGQSYARGYFLGVSNNRYFASDYGICHGFIIEEFINNSEEFAIKTLFQNRGLIDQVFTLADHGSTIGYTYQENGQVIPKTAAVSNDPKRQQFLKRVHTTTLIYAQEIAKTNLAEEYLDEIKSAALLATQIFISRPTRKEVRAIAKIPVSDDPNELRAVPLARPLNIFDLYIIAKDLIFRMKNKQLAQTKGTSGILYKDFNWGFYWLEGSVALSGLWPKVALRGFRLIQTVKKHKKVWLTCLISKLQRIL